MVSEAGNVKLIRGDALATMTLVSPQNSTTLLQMASCHAVTFEMLK